jgi:TPR repeat protein
MEQPAPSVIILEPPPRPPRVLTTNDLPHSTFSGEVFDERSSVLSYHALQAAKGNPEALYAMGMRYLNGVDVAKNEVLAKDSLESARKKGNLRARVKLEELNRRKQRTIQEASQ